jgi:hypothetical protein
MQHVSAFVNPLVAMFACLSEIPGARRRHLGNTQGSAAQVWRKFPASLAQVGTQMRHHRIARVGTTRHASSPRKFGASLGASYAFRKDAGTRVYERGHLGSLVLECRSSSPWVDGAAHNFVNIGPDFKHRDHSSCVVLQAVETMTHHCPHCIQTVPPQQKSKISRSARGETELGFGICAKFASQVRSRF